MRMIDKQMLKTSSLNFNFVRSKILYEGSAWGSIIASRSRNENDPRTYKIGGDMRPVARSRCLTRPLAWQVKLTVRTSIKSHREKQRERERERRTFPTLWIINEVSPRFLSLLAGSRLSSSIRGCWLIKFAWTCLIDNYKRPLITPVTDRYWKGVGIPGPIGSASLTYTAWQDSSCNWSLEDFTARSQVKIKKNVGYILFGTE